MKAVVEAFLVRIEAECVRWRCCRLPLVSQDAAAHMDEAMVASWPAQGRLPQTPDQAVQFLVKRCQGSDETDTRYCLSHSTSWRFEPPDTVVLSYIVCLPERAPLCSQESHTLHMPHATDELPPWQEMRLHDLQLAHGATPSAPSPPRMEQCHVLSHALRHLAFLAHGPGADAAVRRALGPQAKRFLSRVIPALAGQLHLQRDGV